MLRGFYAICDVNVNQALNSDSHPGVIEQAERLLAAKPCMLQLRAKHASPDALWRLAKALKPLAERAAVPFCVNDRLDVALAVGADAVHLGQDDLPLGAVQAAASGWPKLILMGISTHDETQARVAIAAGASYIGFGPVFATHTKQNAEPMVGLLRLAAVAQHSSVPVVGIGGVNLTNVAGVAAAGAAAAAVIAAVNESADPVAAGRIVNAAFDQPKRPVI